MCIRDRLTFARQGDTIVVESISRFARNTRDLLELMEQLNAKGIGFVDREEAVIKMRNTRTTMSCSRFWANTCLLYTSVADWLDQQIQITKEKFETTTKLAHVEIDETGTMTTDYSDEGKLLNRTKFSKKTRVPFFGDKISFFSQYGGDIYSRIIEQPSNFMNLWDLFCLLQPTACLLYTSLSGFLFRNRSFGELFQFFLVFLQHPINAFFFLQNGG